ncbi:MAG: hypothetical protein JST12_14380 [Armatimonadetes bacterium]|nr:hypothetical protein [Armatimonadota bacterium]
MISTALLSMLLLPSVEPVGDFVASADAKKILCASGSPSFVKSQLRYMDLETGDRFDLTTGLDGKEADHSCTNVAISPSGDAVAFTSTATNLIPNGTKRDRVYVWERATKKLRVVSEGISPDVVNARKHDMSVSDGGRTVMFVTGPLNGVPERLWVAESGKKAVPLATRLGLGLPAKEDLRASVGADGRTFTAVVTDRTYNSGKEFYCPMVVAGSLDRGIVTRMPVDYSFHQLGGFVVSSNGLTMAYNDCQHDGKLVTITTWVYQSGRSMAWERVLVRTEKNLTHYPYMLALSGDGNLILYQSSLDKVNTSDQVILRNWKTGRWTNVSVDNEGRPGKTDAGGDAVQMKAFSSNGDGSTVLFTGRDRYGLSEPGLLQPHLMTRDVVAGKTANVR